MKDLKKIFSHENLSDEDMKNFDGLLYGYGLALIDILLINIDYLEKSLDFYNALSEQYLEDVEKDLDYMKVIDTKRADFIKSYNMCKETTNAIITFLRDVGDLSEEDFEVLKDMIK